jgi:hypothetical protein
MLLPPSATLVKQPSGYLAFISYRLFFNFTKNTLTYQRQREENAIAFS